MSAAWAAGKSARGKWQKVENSDNDSCSSFRAHCTATYTSCCVNGTIINCRGIIAITKPNKPLKNTTTAQDHKQQSPQLTAPTFLAIALFSNKTMPASRRISLHDFMMTATKLAALPTTIHHKHYVIITAGFTCVLYLPR